MYKTVGLFFPMILFMFQGYCLQYFYGSFLESRMKSRMTGLYVAGLYVILKNKSFRFVTVFLVIAFQALSDISSYIVIILMDKPQDKLLDMWGWCTGRGMIISEKAFVTAVKASTVGMMFLQYMAIALLLYFSLNRIVWNFQEKDYHISRTELLFILTPGSSRADDLYDAPYHYHNG